MRPAKWCNSSLRSKGIVLAAIAAAPLLVMAGAGYSVETRAAAAQRRIHHTLLVIEEIQRLEISETNASAQIRAYFITREEEFADGVRRAIGAVDLAQQRLAVLRAGNPPQLQRLSRLAEIERSRVERIFGAMTRFRAGHLSPRELRSALLAAENERLLMESVTSAMQQEETRGLQVRLAEADRLRTALAVIAGICLLLGMACGMLVWILFQTGIRGRVKTLLERMERLVSGGFHSRMPGAGDEIGALSDGVTRTTEWLENASHGMAHCDASGRYVLFNKAYSELAGFSKYDAPVSLFASIHGDDWPKVEEFVDRVTRNVGVETRARIVRPDGSINEVELTGGPASGGGFCLLLHDIHLQKQAEAALTRAKDAAIASNAAKTGFLARISHEIRTPLNAILGAADLLSETSLNTDQAEYVGMFQRNCRRLVALINDFLDFSRAEAGAVRIEKKPFRVRQAVHDALETFRESALRKGLTLGVEIAPEVPDWQLGDPLRVQQVLINLLSNALKFTSDGQVSVKVRLGGDAAKRLLLFEVSDSGPGISPADRESIFSPFTQLANQGSVTIRGSGLGLTICRELVHLMGGEIGLSSVEGRGSTFYFSLPLQPTQPGRSARACGECALSSHLHPSSGPVRILIAEDSEDNRVLLKHYLQDEPITLRLAADGQQVIDTVRGGEAFDLILMDIEMPVLDGYTATRLVLEHQAASGQSATPIVAVSAHASDEAVLASLEAGCVAHVSKPIDRATLIETIARHAKPDPASDRQGRAPTVSREVAALVPQYLSSKSKQIEEARSCLASRSFDQIRTFGHNLKGTGRGYGFPEIEELGTAIEKAAQTADEKDIAGQLLALEKFVSQTEDAACGK